ncbi:hypothetical protein GGR57DRAFT_510122 [Xylariaceae sp. FL1272]|nr:hypothetical protein GGR57DRAFT_510122 [Xylariaceae sp. FL1272]
MAPPTVPQAPLAKGSTDPPCGQNEADGGNKSILAIRGLKCKSNISSLTLYFLADVALRNQHILGGLLTFEPFYFFLYDKQQFPELLAALCKTDTEELTVRQHAFALGWECKWWGAYPALVPSHNASEVGGALWRCETYLDVVRLVHHEGPAYHLAYCHVRVPKEGAPGHEVLQDVRAFVSVYSKERLTDYPLVFDEDEEDF